MRTTAHASSASMLSPADRHLDTIDGQGTRVDELRRASAGGRGRVQRGAPDHRHHDEHRHGGRRGPRRKGAAESLHPRRRRGRRRFAAHRLAHARAEVIPEERRRLRHLVARGLRQHRAERIRLRAAALAGRGVPASIGRQPAGVFDQVDELGVGEVSHGSGLQQLLQIRERVEEVGFDGANRAPEDPGNLLVRQIVIHAENQRRPLLLRQPRDGGAYLRRAFAAQQRRVGALDPRVSASRPPAAASAAFSRSPGSGRR